MNDLGDITVAIGLLTTMAIGGTELVKRIFDRDARGAAIILVCTAIGALGGWFLLPVIGLPLGIVTGLGASGLLTGVQKLGTGTASAPSSLKG